MKRFLSPAALALLCWLMGSGHYGYAQTTAMSLKGSVQSDESKPLPGAAITVIHMPSGTRHAAASDGAGRFTVPNLMAGGPYLIQVGEGGYRPQTVENIFLETGKTANFTVTLSKLGTGPGKDQGNRPSEQNGTTMTLAKESVVGGPILITTTPNQSQASYSVSSSTTRSAPARSATSTSPSATTIAQVPPLPAPAPAAEAATAPRYNKYSRSSTTYTRRPAKPMADPIVPGHYDARSGNYIYDTGQLTTLKLAGGGTITGVGVNSTESYLHHFLSDPQMQVDSVDLTQGWYNFDKVFFETGKATLTTESLGQLRNIATLLRAYPKARIKLGGYTDNTGDYKVNRQLSEARARTAWASLVEMGISPARLEARGYGPGYSIAANETEEGRAKNRRLSVKVLQK